MPYTYPYPRPAVTVDAILFRKVQEGYEVLLIQRKHDPYAGKWAFPGGFVDENEDPCDAVLRELQEETGITGIAFHPLSFWGRPGRDPRGHTVSLVFYSITEDPTIHGKAADDAQDLNWFPLKKLPDLAFDHKGILEDALKRCPDLNV